MQFKLTMLALVAGASFAAQAASPSADAGAPQLVAQAATSVPSGNQPHPQPRPAGSTGMESRSDVRSGAAGAAKAGAIDTGNEPYQKPGTPGATQTGNEARPAVRADAASAAKRGAIATGNEPHANDRKKKQEGMNK